MHYLVHFPDLAKSHGVCVKSVDPAAEGWSDVGWWEWAFPAAEGYDSDNVLSFDLEDEPAGGVQWTYWVDSPRGARVTLFQEPGMNSTTMKRAKIILNNRGDFLSFHIIKITKFTEREPLA